MRILFSNHAWLHIWSALGQKAMQARLYRGSSLLLQIKATSGPSSGARAISFSQYEVVLEKAMRTKTGTLRSTLRAGLQWLQCPP